MLCHYCNKRKGIYIVTKTGKVCCQPHRNSCPEMKQKNKEGQKRTGFRWREEDKKEMSKRRGGKNNGMYGKRHTEKSKKKLRQRLSGKTYESLYGLEEAQRLKKNYSQKMKGRKAWNKGMTGTKYLKHFTKESREKHKSFKGKRHSEESKKKIRLLMIKNIERRCGQKAPNYNKKGCKIIDNYGLKNGFSFQHAENGGEYFIEELGYWLDGYDPKKNVAIEIDELSHFDSDGKLTPKDQKRQKEIIKVLRCSFIRVKVDHDSNILEIRVFKQNKLKRR